MPLFFNCGRGAHGRWAPNFLLYHIPRILSRVFAKKCCTNIFPKICATLRLDFWVQMWYNNSVKGRETKTSTNRGVGKVIQWTL